MDVKKKSPPILEGLPAVYHSLRFSKNPLSFLDEIKQSYSRIVRLKPPVGPSMTIILHPELVREVLIKRHNEFPRPTIDDEPDGALTQRGLVEVEGDTWFKQRSRLQQGFSGSMIDSYAARTAELVTERISEWDQYNHIDLHEEFTRLSVEILADTLFGTSLSQDEIDKVLSAKKATSSEFGLTFQTLLKYVLPSSTPDDINTLLGGDEATRSSDDDRAVAEAKRWADSIIESQKQTPSESSGVLQFLLQAEAVDDSDITHSRIRDEIFTFLMAGHETTALVTTYTLALLSESGHSGDVEQEIRSINPPHQWDSVPNLPATEASIHEAMRLYPPAWTISRETASETHLGQFRIAESELLLLPQWSIHRDNRFFDRPMEFVPQRWTNGSTTDNAYFPFGMGKHTCIGKGFALMEAKIIIAAILREYDIRILNEMPLSVSGESVLRPDNGVRLQAKNLI